MKKGDKLKNIHTGDEGILKDIVYVKSARNPVYVIEGHGRYDSKYIVNWKPVSKNNAN